MIGILISLTKFILNYLAPVISTMSLEEKKRILQFFEMHYEREIEANCREIRKLVEEIIRNRRDACLKDPSMKLRGDFLQILLDDETTSGDEQLIVDECLTFFFAGSQTSNLSSTNLIYMLVKHPEYRKNILKELEKVVVQPYLQANLSKVDSFDILDLMDFENTGDL